MKDACQRYLEEPEANAGHLAECAECRALFDTLGLAVDDRPISMNALPLAPWEGASHRAWPLVLGGVALMFAIALAVCAWAGVPPLRVVQSSLATVQNARGVFANAASSLREASLAVQVGFGLLFVAVNTALVLLLRRAPRGIDA
jgi:predicted anti-sigma-YlaC factor YlaD